MAYLDAVNAVLADAGIDIAAAKPGPGDTERHETHPEHRSGAKDRIMSAYNGGRRGLRRGAGAHRR